MRWHESRRAGLGAELLGAVHAVLVRVGSAPHQFTAWPENPRFRRALAVHFPYAVHFHIVGDEPVVVAIAHTSRHPKYWLDRSAKNEESP